MRYSQIAGKEIIDLERGERLGQIGETDLDVNPLTGEIRAIILPANHLFGFRRRREEVVIPWQHIRKIGPEMIIVEVRRNYYLEKP
ncbi:YlmC/YmxH family sporulation protein [Rubeoparvulum massiliense]|uniref:YlmC/YmxH family sporulation protein n=1 Tax=Rubeoparvulum massiliense TaxID=1631346 RepID=UPI00065DFCE8|nr:YlmC/YmxH family sporulation protein [Rubeoparvulum massiliense]